MSCMLEPSLQIENYKLVNIDYRLVVCQDRFLKMADNINLQQLVEDFNRLSATAMLSGLKARQDIVRYIAHRIDHFSVVEDLDTGYEEAQGVLKHLVSELYDLKPDAAVA